MRPTLISKSIALDTFSPGPHIYTWENTHRVPGDAYTYICS